MIDVKRDAELHWKYTYGLIKVVLLVCAYLYKAAYIHGHKHGQSEMEIYEPEVD